MPKLDPIQKINRISDDVKRIVWICQNCKQLVSRVQWPDDSPLCASCARALELHDLGEQIHQARQDFAEGRSYMFDDVWEEL